MKKLSNTPVGIGIDVAKAKIDVAIISINDDVIHHQFSNQSEENMLELIQWLKDNQVSEAVPIVVESTSSYHWLSCIMLSEHGFDVRLINPLITKRYEKSSIRGAKTDTVDAKRLAEIAIIENDLPLFFDSRESLSNKKYHSLYAKIQKVKQQLNRAYKEALESAEYIGVSLELDSLELCLKQIDNTLKALRTIIESNVSETAVKLTEEVRGVSKFQASVICNALAGRKFDSKDKLIAFFGLDIRVKQSGTWRGKEKLSKRGNSFYRMILFQLGWSLSRNNAEFQAYYQRLRDDGKHYYTALIATARKFLRFFFAYYLQKGEKVISFS